MPHSMANNAGQSPAGLSYSLSGYDGSPWPQTAIVKDDGAVLWPVRIFSERWQWWLHYRATNKQVLIGDEVRIGIVADIRQCGRIAISYADKITWVSPAQIGARWIEYRAGKLVHEYGLP
jgi:hypothetical protein